MKKLGKIAEWQEYKKVIENLKWEDRKEFDEWLNKFNADNLYIPVNPNLQELCIRMLVDLGYASYHHPINDCEEQQKGDVN